VQNSWFEKTNLVELALDAAPATQRMFVFPCQLALVFVLIQMQAGFGLDFEVRSAAAVSSSLWVWCWSINKARIGILYVLFALGAGVIGLTMSFSLRLSLGWPSACRFAAAAMHGRLAAGFGAGLSGLVVWPNHEHEWTSRLPL
jgi:hypothetical protein